MNITVYSINHQHTRFTCSFDAKVTNNWHFIQCFSVSDLRFSRETKLFNHAVRHAHAGSVMLAWVRRCRGFIITSRINCNFSRWKREINCFKFLHWASFVKLSYFNFISLSFYVTEFSDVFFTSHATVRWWSWWCVECRKVSTSTRALLKNVFWCQIIIKHIKRISFKSQNDDKSFKQRHTMLHVSAYQRVFYHHNFWDWADGENVHCHPDYYRRTWNRQHFLECSTDRVHFGSRAKRFLTIADKKLYNILYEMAK